MRFVICVFQLWDFSFEPNEKKIQQKNRTQTFKHSNSSSILRLFKRTQVIRKLRTDLDLSGVALIFYAPCYFAVVKGIMNSDLIHKLLVYGPLFTNSYNTAHYLKSVQQKSVGRHIVLTTELSNIFMFKISQTVNTTPTVINFISITICSNMLLIDCDINVIFYLFQVCTLKSLDLIIKYHRTAAIVKTYL